jgi:hypothetical protein
LTSLRHPIECAPWVNPLGGHYVPYFIGHPTGYARVSRSYDAEDSSNHARFQPRDDGKRIGASTADAVEKRFGTSTADTVEEWLGTSSADSMEERIGASTADTVERLSAGSANPLVRVSD